MIAQNLLDNSDPSLSPRCDHGDTDHVVQFYESDSFLVESLARFVGAGLSVGDRVLLVATPEHRRALEEMLKSGALDLGQASARGDFVCLDANETLASFMVDRAPDRGLFFRHIGEMIAGLGAGGRRVRAFGEMVALLWGEGLCTAAIVLEDLWNELARKYAFSLFCAYPMDAFADGSKSEMFRHICSQHSRVLPSEDYSALADSNARMCRIAVLQQQAKALDVETTRRKEAEDVRLLLASIVDSSDDAIVSKSLEGIITSWNAGAARIFGYSAEEVIGQPVAMLFPVDRLGEEDEILAKLRRGERVDHFETVRMRKDGTPVDVSLTISPVRDSSGRLAGASKIARDITERKRAQRLLGEREQFLRAIVEATPECINVVAEDGTLLEMNPAGLALVEAGDVDAVRGKSVFALIAPEDRARFEAFHHRVCAGEKGYLEFDIVGLQGTRRSMESYAVGLLRPDGSRAQLALARDVTARKRAQRALRESEAQFRQLANAMPQIVWTARPDGVVDYFNDRWYDFTGFSREAENDAGWKILHPDDVDRCRETYYGCIRTGRDYQIEYRFHDRTTGEYRWFLGRAHPVRDESGKIVRWFGTCTDIDETKRAEARLEKQNQRLRLLNEAAGHLLAAEEPAAMVQGLFHRVRDHLGTDIYFTFILDEASSALSLLSCDGLSAEAQCRVARLESGHAASAASARERHPTIASHVQLSADPKLRWLKDLGVRAYACNPLLANHRLLGTVSFASTTRDSFEPDELEFIRTLCHYVAIAYERLRLLKKLRQEDKKKDEFLATIAHELRNPLAPIRSSLDLFRLGPQNATTHAQLYQIMERQVHQLTRLVDDLLEISRITSGKISLRREVLDIAAVIQNAVDTSGPLIEKGRHRLTQSLASEPIMVDGDPVRLAQVFANLLNNAAKYTDEGGHIQIALKRDGGDAVISIRDNGVGIPRDMLPRVFDMFAQIDRTLNRAQGGLGIGLALAKKLVELHGGRIDVASDGPGKGSEFVIRLAAMDTCDRAAAQDAPDGSNQRPARRRRVLVVDDNRDAALSLTLLLQTFKHTTRVAFDGAQALEMAGDFHPEVVLLDIGLPHVNGYEVARRLRSGSASTSLTLIALTGWGQEDDRRKAREAGFDYHFTKPVDIDALITLLETTGSMAR